MLPSAIGARLAAEDQAQNKPDAERGEDRLGRIVAHVLFAILLESAHPAGRIVPDFLGSSAILVRYGSRCALEFLRGPARMGNAALRRGLGLRDAGPGALCHIFVCHILLLG